MIRLVQALVAFVLVQAPYPALPYPPYVMPSQPPSGAALSCLNSARSFEFLNEQDAYDLCQGAQNLGPYECFQRARRGMIDSKTAIRLCRCALDAARVDCYERAHQTTTLSEDEILGLCTNDQGAAGPCNPKLPSG